MPSYLPAYLSSPSQHGLANPLKPQAQSRSPTAPHKPRQTNNSRLMRNTPRTSTVLPQLRASVIAITNRRIRGRDGINQHPIVNRVVTIRVIRSCATVARETVRRPDNAHGRGTAGDFQVAEIIVLLVVQFAGAGRGASGIEVAGAEAVFLAFDAWG